MTTEIEDLASFVNRVMIEKNLSTYEVAGRSGGGISQGMVSKIRNGDVLTPSLPKLKGLAKGTEIFLDHYTGVDVENARMIGAKLSDFVSEQVSKAKVKAKVDFWWIGAVYSFYRNLIGP